MTINQLVGWASRSEAHPVDGDGIFICFYKRSADVGTLRFAHPTLAEAGWPEGTAIMRYAVVIEKADGNYSAYVPDLPGCVATGETVDAVEAEIREAIRLHIDGLKHFHFTRM